MSNSASNMYNTAFGYRQGGDRPLTVFFDLYNDLLHCFKRFDSPRKRNFGLAVSNSTLQ